MVLFILMSVNSRLKRETRLGFIRATVTIQSHKSSDESRRRARANTTSSFKS